MKFRRSREDRGKNVYIPTPKMIRVRCANLLWMQRAGFSEEFIAMVFKYDLPRMSQIRHAIDYAGLEPCDAELMFYDLYDLLEDEE